MLDNLRYKPNGDAKGTVTASFSAAQVTEMGASNMLTVSGTSSGGTNYDNYNSAKYIDPVIAIPYCYNNNNKPVNNITKCGLLYNFFTATAGTAPNTVKSGKAAGSICPTNWHLPTGQYSTDDFGTLDKAYNGAGSYHTDTAVMGSLWHYTGAFGGIFSHVYTTSFSQYATGGYLWSSQVQFDSGAYFLSFNASFVQPSNNSLGRFAGMGVRCVIGT
jgi:uncharacterized protein (TIGR02145 family)